MKSIQIELCTVVNLTPHALNVIDTFGEITVIPPSGLVARVESTRGEMDSVGQISLWGVEYGEVTGLENLTFDGRDTIFITSALAKVPVRKHLEYVTADMWEEGDAPTLRVVSPGELVRNDEGQPIGCKGLDL